MVISTRSHSSVGQSVRLITVRSAVRARVGPLLFFISSSSKHRPAPPTPKSGKADPQNDLPIPQQVKQVLEDLQENMWSAMDSIRMIGKVEKNKALPALKPVTLSDQYEKERAGHNVMVAGARALATYGLQKGLDGMFGEDQAETR